MLDPFIKLVRLPWTDRVLLIEATLALAGAAVAAAVLPFRTVAAWSDRPIRRPKPAAMRPALVERVRWAVLVCARRVPWRAMCLQQGLAAQFMLRRRGIPATLYYGAAPHDGSAGLLAHAWLKAGDIEVVGGESAAQFAVLATFPRQQGASEGASGGTGTSEFTNEFYVAGGQRQNGQ